MTGYTRQIERCYNNKYSAINVLSQPTAPFREDWVRKEVQSWCRQNRFNCIPDSFGNLWVNVKSISDLTKTKLIFVAHLDHPGIVVHDFLSNGIATGEWLGGGPVNLKGQAVKLFSTSKVGVSSYKMLDGEIIENESADGHPTQVKIKFKSNMPVSTYYSLMPWGACLWFPELKDSYEKKDDTWVVRAADDLFLVWSLLEALCSARPIETDVVVLLTRSEEKGLIGSYFAAADTPLTNNAKVIAVDLASSSDHADGVMVRWKDKNRELNKVFADTIYKKLKDTCKCYMQKKDSKGRTDSTAFSELGFCSAGLSIPLTNYHNKKDKLVAPEEISDSDRLSLITAVRILMRG